MLILSPKWVIRLNLVSNCVVQNFNNMQSECTHIVLKGGSYKLYLGYRRKGMQLQKYEYEMHVYAKEAFLDSTLNHLFTEENPAWMLEWKRLWSKADNAGGALPRVNSVSDEEHQC